MKTALMRGSLGLSLILAVVSCVSKPSKVFAQVKPGDFVTPDRSESIRNLVSPGVYARIQRGMTMKIVPTQRIEWPPPYREATEKYAAQVRLTPDHQSLMGYVAGMPFPFIDPNDPHAGTKLMWNYTFRPTSTDDYDVRDLSCITVSAGRDRPYSPINYYEIGHLASYSLVGRTEVNPIPVDPEFPKTGRLLLIGFYPMLAPEEDRGWGFIRYRYAREDIGDDLWSWLPGMRRIRRMNEASQGTAVGAITWSSDNFQGFAAKNENYDWRLLGEKQMLACITASHVPVTTCSSDGGASACPEEWQMRHLYIVEGVPRRDRIPEELFGRHILYIDSEAIYVMYQDLYSRSGELWKNYTAWVAYRDRAIPDARIAVYPFKRLFHVGASIEDVNSGFATMCYMPSPEGQEHESWYINMGAVDKDFFTVASLVAAAH